MDEFDELQRTLDAELEGLEKIVKRQVIHNLKYFL